MACNPIRHLFVKLRSAFEETIKRLTTGGRRILLIGDQIKSICSINRARLLDGPLPHAPQPACRHRPGRLPSKLAFRSIRCLPKFRPNVVLMRPVDYFCGALCPSVQDGMLYFDSTRLPDVLRKATAAPAYAERLRGIKATLPFGGLVAGAAGSFGRLCTSPGPISRAGSRPSRSLTPSARALGCAVDSGRARQHRGPVRIDRGLSPGRL
jgi:hypothetical protein